MVDGGDLSVQMAAAQLGTYGLQCIVDDTNGIYGQKNVTVSNDDLRFRFFIDPNSLTMADGDAFRIVHWRLDAVPFNLCFVTLQYTTILGYYLIVSAEEDDGTTLTSGNITISDASHCVEIHVERATSDVADDGRVRTWIDTILQDTISNIDNYDLWDDISDVRMGAIIGLDVGTSGIFYLDDLALMKMAQRLDVQLQRLALLALLQ